MNSRTVYLKGQFVAEGPSHNCFFVRDGAPGPITDRLTQAWIEDVGSDWRSKALSTLKQTAE